MKAEGKPAGPLKTDAPFYSEEELDALYEHNPVAALWISCEQHRLQQLIGSEIQSDPNAPLPSAEEVATAPDARVRRSISSTWWKS